MKKIIAFLIVVLFVWCAGIQTGKNLERERSREVRRARSERLTLFAKNRTEGTWYQKSAEKFTDVIGEILN